jgi:hypothetical protein
MTVQRATSRARARSAPIEAVVDAAATGATAAIDAGDELGDDLQDRLRDVGRNLLDGATMVTDELRRQARVRPLATFGVAVLAGLIAARALRR